MVAQAFSSSIWEADATEEAAIEEVGLQGSGGRVNAMPQTGLEGGFWA